MNSQHRLISAAFLCLVAATAGASAQSLKSLRQQEADNAALEREAAYTSSVCGAPISARIDWSSASSWPESDSLAAACDGALGALETICRSDRARAGKVSSFVCAGDGNGPSVSGGTFRYGASPGGDGYSSSLSYLEGAL
ncbi:MAG: hypothetical protein ABL957_07730 [Parvularculaceae bacterium]